MNKTIEIELTNNVRYNTTQIVISNGDILRVLTSEEIKNISFCYRDSKSEVLDMPWRKFCNRYMSKNTSKRALVLLTLGLTVRDVISHSNNSIGSIIGIGPKTLREIKKALEKFNLHFSFK